VFKCKKEARLRFVSGYSIQFDTFPDYALHEVVPFIWDCRPAQVLWLRIGALENWARS